MSHMTVACVHVKQKTKQKKVSEIMTWAQFHRAASAKKKCLSTKIARLFFTCYWQICHAIYIACDSWYLAVVNLALQWSGVLADNLILVSKDVFA